MATDITQASPGVAQASNTSKPVDPISSLFREGATLPDFFSGLFYAAIAIGATLAVLRLGYAGFLYMVTDIWGEKRRATTMIQEVVLGLLLLLAVWIILSQINPDILDLNILQPKK